MNTILVKNGLVYDGTDSPGAKKDILVKGSKVVAVAPFLKRKADKIIDAIGGIVIPGIIDINTDSDHFLSVFFEPYQEDFIKQGVTTIIGGNCGSSLAPLIDGSLRSISGWGDPSRLNINWRTVKEFLNVLEERKPGINFGTLIGHSTVRRALTNDQARDLTQSEIDAFKEIAAKSLKEGAFGLSTGLGYLQMRQTPYREILELVKTVAGLKGLYATHLRDVENEIKKAVEETIELSREAGVNLEISHFQPRRNFSKLYRESKELLEKESARNFINFDCYPFETTALPIHSFLPNWAQDGQIETMLEYVLAEHLKNRLLNHFKKMDFENMTIGCAPPPLKQLAGKKMIDFAGDINLKPDEALLKLMHLTHLKALIFYQNIDGGMLEEFMLSPQAFVSSNGVALPSEEFKHERNYNTFPKFLGWAAKSKKIPVEKAVMKITSLPAQKYGISERGLIKEGCFADLAVLHDYKATETLVNGQLVLEEGRPAKILAGQILRKKA